MMLAYAVLILDTAWHQPSYDRLMPGVKKRICGKQ